jgi:uncharacterized protein YlxW (UPF0749 family)
MFGAALMVQLRTENRLRETTPSDSSTDLAAIAGDLYDNNSQLRQQVDQLLAQRTSQAQTQDPSAQAALGSELDRLKAFNGVLPVTGPGVELILDATLRPVDLLDLLNELRNAGAEAVAIGGQRIVYKSAITGSPGRLVVNQTVVDRPLVVQAIGAPDVLDRALARKGGMLSYLRTAYPKATIDMTTKDSLTLPAYGQPLPIRPSA